ncbi:MAG: NAD(P)-dependent oxidoreductase [Candidatus Thorarchaeota archaeon]
MKSRHTNVLYIWEVPEDLQKFLTNGLREVEDVNLIFPSPASEDEYLKHVETANVIVGWRPSDELLSKARNLDLFINPGAGVQHLIARFRDLNTRRKVILVNGHGNSYFTAQHAVALLLSLSNKIIPHHNWMVEGKWRRGDDYAKSIPLRWKKIGLLGYGAVNQKVHKFLAGFDNEFHVLKTQWNDEIVSPTQIVKYTPNQFHAFLKEVDILIIAVPHTDDTESMIGIDELELLGENGLLVNMSRGSVINEGALYDSLKEKKIAGAAIDVWYNYQPEPDVIARRFPFTRPFFELDNVILSPHRGASPMDDLHRWNEVIENITRYASGREDFLNQVSLDRGY